MRRIYHFFRYVGRLSYYEGIDTPTLTQWLYRWRISPRTAWEVAGILTR